MMLYTTKDEYVVLEVFQRCVAVGVYQETLYMKHRGKLTNGLENETTSYQDDMLLDYILNLGFSRCDREDVTEKM